MTEEENTNIQIHKLLVVGYITSEDFQKCRYAVTKLHKSFSNEFEAPEIRSMLDVEWNGFITKYQRRLGTGLWWIKNRVAVFRNGEFLGDFNDLHEFIWKKWKFVFHEDWYDMGCRHLIDYLTDKTENYRQLVYLTIAINNQVVGTLLFELYNDIVPLACENFLNRCRNEENGYIGTQIHRIVKNSWIQGGGFDLNPIQIPCENYVVPHDRRGVLSMCNNGPHTDNSTQFCITLDSAPWMNYKYVAFGQLIQGDDVLNIVASVPTYYQSPTNNITIVKCGEYQTGLKASSSTVLFTTEEINQHWEKLRQQVDILTYLRTCHQVMGAESAEVHSFLKDDKPKVSADSLFLYEKFKNWEYSLKTDIKSYTPFKHLPDYVSDGDEADEDYNICGSSYPFSIYKNKLLQDGDTNPVSSNITL